MQDLVCKHQVLYTAIKGNIQADPVVLTLLDEVVVPELTFVETTDYICHNNYIYATSSTNSSIRYSLKNKVAGVHIDQSTGLVTFTGAAKEGDKFTVVISSNGATEEKEFTVAKEHLVKVIKDKHDRIDKAIARLDKKMYKRRDPEKRGK